MKTKLNIIIGLVFLTAITVFSQTNDVAGTVSTTETANVWALINAMVEQILNSPASLLVIIGLSILAYVFEVTEWLPTKFVLPLCVFGGAISYWIFSSPGSVTPNFPYPLAVLVVNGLVCGLFAFIVHSTLIKWFINRFQPGTIANKADQQPKP